MGFVACPGRSDGIASPVSSKPRLIPCAPVDGRVHMQPLARFPAPGGVPTSRRSCYLPDYRSQDYKIFQRRLEVYSSPLSVGATDRMGGLTTYGHTIIPSAVTACYRTVSDKTKYASFTGATNSFVQGRSPKRYILFEFSPPFGCRRTTREKPNESVMIT